jgi:rhomboid protease GluP
MSQATDQLAPRSVETHPLVVVLRVIAQAAPQPWFPYRAEGFARDRLDDVLEVLWMQQLIEKAPTSKEEGPALRLTALGERVLHDPELTARLVRGEAIDPSSPAAVVRANLANPPRVQVCKVILALNVAVFLWGLYLASNQGITKSFLQGFTLGQKGWLILHKTGSVIGTDLAKGEWWRLISSGFNHGGAIHLVMNMYALYAVGWFIEQRWGWWRFLVIYLVSVWTGGCLAMAYQPGILTLGASGGIFGVFAAVIGWLLLYGKYLPASGRRRAWRNVLTNVILISVLSFLLRDYVSHWGHIGGAIGGFVSCFVLHVQRFGRGVLRLAAAALILLLPLGGWITLQKAMANGPAWAKTRKILGVDEATTFRREVGDPVSDVVARTLKVCKKHINPLLDRHPSRWDAQQVENALAALQKQEESAQEARELLSAVTSKDKNIALARDKGLEALQEGTKLLEVSLRYVRLGEKKKNADEQRIVDQFGKADDAEHEWLVHLKKLGQEKP